MDVYLVSSEQLFPFQGHIPCFAMFMEISKFTKNISYLFVNEAHFISTSGFAENGQPAHWPLYAQLGELQACLPVGTVLGNTSTSCAHAVQGEPAHEG